MKKAIANFDMSAFKKNLAAISAGIRARGLYDQERMPGNPFPADSEWGRKIDETWRLKRKPLFSSQKMEE